MRSAGSKPPEAFTFNVEYDSGEDLDVEILDSLPIGAIFIGSDVDSDSDDPVYGDLTDLIPLSNDSDRDDSEDLGNEEQQEYSNESLPDGPDPWENTLLLQLAEVLSSCQPFLGDRPMVDPTYHKGDDNFISSSLVDQLSVTHEACEGLDSLHVRKSAVMALRLDGNMVGKMLATYRWQLPALVNCLFCPKHIYSRLYCQ